jgi:hypothetical protein
MVGVFVLGPKKSLRIIFILNSSPKKEKSTVKREKEKKENKPSGDLISN